MAFFERFVRNLQVHRHLFDVFNQVNRVCCAQLKANGFLLIFFIYSTSNSFLERHYQNI